MSTIVVNSDNELNISNRDIIQLPDLSLYYNTLRVLDCSSCSIRHFPDLSGFVALKVLKIKNNHTTSIVSLPPFLEELDCVENNLSTLPKLPDTLLKLYCSDNSFGDLGILPMSLLELNIGDCRFDILPILPPNLLILDCYFTYRIPSMFRTMENDGSVRFGLPTTLRKLSIYDETNQIVCPRLPDNLKWLFFKGKYLPISFPETLTRLHCTGKRMNRNTVLPPRLTRLEIVYRYRHQSFPVLPDTIKRLVLTGKNVVDITLPPNVDNLTLYCEKLETIGRIPENIKKIVCNGCSLVALPDLSHCRMLKMLMIHHNRLIELPELPDSLNYLDCGNNKITKLPKLPKFLNHLSCDNNPISELPELPPNLNWLSCSDTDITWLPDLPDNLSLIQSSKTRLTTLPRLPKNLNSLNCYHNRLISLPELPPKLQSLNCYNNKITVLPELPDSLISLNLGRNNLIMLPNIPTNARNSRFHNNWITSIPEPLLISRRYVDINKNWVYITPELSRLFRIPETPNYSLTIRVIQRWWRTIAYRNRPTTAGGYRWCKLMLPVLEEIIQIMFRNY